MCWSTKYVRCISHLECNKWYGQVIIINKLRVKLVKEKYGMKG